MNARTRSELIDDMVEMYIQWREECLSLNRAYTRWASAPHAEQVLAFAAYRAALDREEQASSAYAERIDRISREPMGAVARAA